jgi:ribosome-associated protein
MNLKVRGEYITLGQLLKVAGLAGTGGEAKFLLSEGGITVNGEPEERRGRKLRPGDTVHLPDGQHVTLE